jgi:hypothetical protein
LCGSRCQWDPALTGSMLVDSIWGHLSHEEGGVPPPQLDQWETKRGYGKLSEDQVPRKPELQSQCPQKGVDLGSPAIFSAIGEPRWSKCGPLGSVTTRSAILSLESLTTKHWVVTIHQPSATSSQRNCVFQRTVFSALGKFKLNPEESKLPCLSSGIICICSFL